MDEVPVAVAAGAALATRSLRIEPSRLGEQAGLTGRAAMVLDNIISAEAVDTAAHCRPDRRKLFTGTFRISGRKAQLPQPDVGPPGVGMAKIGHDWNRNLFELNRQNDH